MRVLCLNVCAILVAYAVVQAYGDSTIDLNPVIISPFLSNSNNTLLVMDLMKKHFDDSLKYLYTSKQYGSQFVERPGMAKLLMDASDNQWEEGLDFLKKYLQRGGTLDENFVLSFTGKGELTLDNTEVIADKYVNTLKDIVIDSISRSHKMNKMHHVASKWRHGDPEIGHFLDNKLKAEAEYTRKMAGHVVTLKKMKTLGVALNMFDANL
ncbi:uncharacterized protein LOC121872560 isoform X2 [Homarus americanus]|nr:uncharacterized protein LOC121872560 isoform X2 [Homarus americanus]